MLTCAHDIAVFDDGLTMDGHVKHERAGSIPGNFEPGIEIQRACDMFQCQPQQNHGERHFRLDADYHRTRAAQLD
ncbi:MAG: hypothetical protein ACR2P3_04555 [Geminicoccaceae bacterium]